MSEDLEDGKATPDEMLSPEQRTAMKTEGEEIKKKEWVKGMYYGDYREKDYALLQELMPDVCEKFRACITDHVKEGRGSYQVDDIHGHLVREIADSYLKQDDEDIKRSLISVIDRVTRGTIENLSHQEYYEPGVVHNLGGNHHEKIEMVKHNTVFALSQVNKFSEALEWLQKQDISLRFRSMGLELIKDDYREFRKHGGERDEDLEQAIKGETDYQKHVKTF